MATVFQSWSEYATEFKKWAQGENKVRFVSPPVQFERKFKGERSTQLVAVVLDVDDGLNIKYARLTATLMRGLRAFTEEHKLAPHDPRAPGFIVTREGTGVTDTRYSIRPGSMPIAIPDEINIQKVSMDLLAYARAQEGAGESPAVPVTVKPALEDFAF